MGPQGDLTHWSDSNRKGRRINRIYSNFAMDMEVKHQTLDFDFSDHKGILLGLTNIPPPE